MVLVINTTMKQNHPSNHKDTEEDYFSEKEDVDENSDDDGNKNDENQGILRPVLVPGTKQMTRHFFSSCCLCPVR